MSVRLRSDLGQPAEMSNSLNRRFALSISTAIALAAGVLSPLLGVGQAIAAPVSTAEAATSTSPLVVSASQWKDLHTRTPQAVSSGTAIAQSVSHAQAVQHLSSTLFTIAGVPAASTAVDGSTPKLADGSVEVTVTGTGAVTALRASGARIVAQADGAATAVVRPERLIALAGSHGVDLVAPIRRAYTESTPESVHTSLADTWQGSTTGTGVTIGIVDAGFGGTLPSNATLVSNHCADYTAEVHGTAVADIVSAMAPGATIKLYCVDDTVGLAQAGAELKTSGVSIVSCSLGFINDARGDGTGTSTAAYRSADTTVAALRKAGILWINSAGNSAQDHWSGTFSDTNSNGWVDLRTAADDFDQIVLPAGASADLVLTWNQWPSSTLTPNIRVDAQNLDTQASVGYAVGIRPSDLPGSPVRIVPITNPTSADWLLNVRVSVPKKDAGAALRPELPGRHLGFLLLLGQRRTGRSWQRHCSC